LYFDYIGSIIRLHFIIISVDYFLKKFIQTGFIKAFSNSVQSFTFGFGHIERIMRTLFIKELYIWPRFHSTVIQSLKEYEVYVYEICYNMNLNLLLLARSYRITYTSFEYYVENTNVYTRPY